MNSELNTTRRSLAAPADATGTNPPGSGLISLFARHHTAPNLLMLVLIIIGIFSLTRLNRQFFPDFQVPIISVNVPWPGASAEDVERNILDVLEPELRFIEGIEEVTSYAREGNATIALEFLPTADIQKAQADIEQAVGRVTTLPEESERPIISRAAFFEGVASILVTGPFSEQALKAYAKQVRDGLLAAGIDRVTLTGARAEEVRVSLREADLRRLGLTPQDVADRIRANTQDLPAGTLEGRAELQIRSRAERRTPDEIGRIEIKAGADGQRILLRDIADVRTAFERDGIIALVDGRQAIQLQVERAVSADTLRSMRLMDEYIEKARAQLPPTLELIVYDVRGRLVQQRLDILTTNGIQGLILVLVTLFVFLNARIAFWTAAGIPIAMLATLGLMLATGQSINMISMFGLIMMLGIVVDDAIVVGEHAATLEEQGMPRPLAAEQAGIRMMAPVTAATLTTVAAFLPITLIGGRIGDILIAVPLVAMAALFASLIECFLILPGHLRHGTPRNRRPWLFRRAFDASFAVFRDRIFGPFVDLAYRWRYTTFATLIGCFILALGLVAGGRVSFVFFPNLPPENASANVTFAPGTPREAQIRAVVEISEALRRAEAKLLDKAWRDAEAAAAAGDADTRVDQSLVVAAVTILGRSGRTRGDNLAEIDVQFTPTEERVTPFSLIVNAWRAEVPNIAGIERLVISGRRSGPPGRDLDIRLQNAPSETLKAAAEEVKAALTALPGTSAIDDDLPYGKRELVVELTPRGAALGFTGQTVGRQLRNAFEGAIAVRFARDDDEITVRVLREQAGDGLTAMRSVFLAAPDGTRVPLLEVVSFSERQTFSLVQRRDGIRTVGVTADLDTNVLTTEAAIAQLEANVMPGIAAKYGISYRYAGRAQESGDSFRDLRTGALLAVAMIYIILGWVFAHYWKPLAVMAIIPFGFVGAVLGHYVLGYNLTIISMIGLLGLSGILVNDSIVLVSRLNERLRDGEDLESAATGAARDRLRAVLLTSITTMAGLTPLMFEQSLQAQFLIPLAITIVFGVGAATILVLVLVPALMGIGQDLGRVAGAVGRLYGPRPSPAS